MSCVPVDEQLRILFDRLTMERVEVDDIPPDLHDQLRRWGWVIGSERLELTGIGWYHTGSTKGGLLDG